MSAQGVWHLETDDDQTAVLDVTIQNHVFTGSLSGDLGERTITGVVNDAQTELTWIDVEDGDKPVRTVHTLKIDGEELTGTIKVGREKSLHLTGKRV